MTTTTAVNVRELACEVDTILAGLHEATAYHQQRLEWAADAVRRAAGQTRNKEKGRRHEWSGTLSEALAQIDAEGDHYDAQSARDYRHQAEILTQIKTERADCSEVYFDYQWSRAFLVTNGNGHVHKSMDCGTCFATTRFEWLTFYSGADEDEIVKAAGETACTVCYPSAPSDYLNRPADLVSKTREEKDAAKAVRAAEKAAREAKRIAKSATRDGAPLFVPCDEEYPTERDYRGQYLTSEAAATKLWTDIELGKTSDRLHMRPAAAQLEAQDIITRALAEKHDRTGGEQQAVLQGKAAAKAKRDAAAAKKWNERYGR
jgi:hypothetical protein